MMEISNLSFIRYETVLYAIRWAVHTVHTHTQSQATFAIKINELYIWGSVPFAA